MRMSKEILRSVRQSRRFGPSHLCLISAILAVLLSIVAAPLFTSTAQPAPPQTLKTGDPVKNAALVAATQEVLKETSEVRELPIIRAVISSTQSRAEIERAMIKDLDEQTTAADLHASEVTMKKLGLAPPDFHYRDLMVRVLTEQVAGYYEPKTRQFHLADWIDIDGQKPIMAHELTHALQDQHFDLRRFEHWPKGDSDAELAAHALVEGDATLAMIMYVGRNPLRALTFLKSMAASGMATEELDKAPRALRETLLFPYQEGLSWTRAVYKQGGWDDVSHAFAALPQSTEQVMHPEKYFAHEAPVKVTLPDVTPLLNKSELPAVAGAAKSIAGWKRIASDVNGEWGTYLLLDEFLKAPAESHRAAAGWAGDRYAVYEDKDGQVLYLSATAWDTENDAREFFDAYVKRLRVRYGNASVPEATEPSPSLITFQTSEGGVAIQLSHARVIIAEGVPESINAKSLLKPFLNGS